ncbi:branched-chain amino acid ABC transporter permease [Rhodopseudomonas sp. NSM]|uniref:branched-chain amino acid ABC transporter permease n=1 Tax=Rhodopseudomonas sp. NSM TaxID=3457630 RepID=UPI0040375749
MTNERTSLIRSSALPAICLIAALALPFVVPVYYVQFASKALILGVLAMALNLVVGQSGLVSLCHAAFFGLAGYVLALLSPKYDAASLLLTWPAAVLAASVAALVIGALALRTRGVYFIMVTLAFGEMLFYLFHDADFAGGSDGAFINVKPELVIAGARLLDLDKPLTFYFLVLGVTVAVIALLVTVVRSPFGHALAAARDNERRARALGFPIFRIRLIAFVLSGALSGVAGYFAAVQFGFVAPQMLGWHQSATVLVMVLIGGLSTVTGPLIGALVLLGLEEVLKATFEQWKLIEGAIIIAIVLLLPNGVRQLWPMVFGEAEPKQVHAKQVAPAPVPAPEAGHG